MNRLRNVIRACPLIASVVAVVSFVTPFATDAQPARNAYRIGLLGLGGGAASPGFAALRQGLRERGYVEGQKALPPLPSSMFRAHRVRIVELAARYRLDTRQSLLRAVV